MALTVLRGMIPELFPVSAEKKISKESAYSNADQDGGIGIVVNDDSSLIGLSADLLACVLIDFLAAIDQLVHAVSCVMAGVFSGVGAGGNPVACSVCGFLDVGFYGIEYFAHNDVIGSGCGDQHERFLIFHHGV